MEKMRRGRPKSKEPIRDKNINFRVSEKEYNDIQNICNENDIRYIDVFLKGLDFWSKKQ